MNKRCLLPCALFLCSFLPCAAQSAPAAPPQPSPFNNTAKNAMQQYAQTLVTGTPAQIAAFYNTQGQLLLPGTLPITGPKEVEAFLAPLVKQAKVTGVAVKIDELPGTMRVSTLMGTYAETYVTPDGKAQTVTGRFASIWELYGANSRWEIVRLMMQPAPTK